MGLRMEKIRTEQVGSILMSISADSPPTVLNAPTEFGCHIRF